MDLCIGLQIQRLSIENSVGHMKITIPITQNHKAVRDLLGIGKYVQAYEDSTMKTYKQQVKTILEEQNLN